MEERISEAKLEFLNCSGCIFVNIECVEGLFVKTPGCNWNFGGTHG
jgi:hypothetical protein